jgi:hypothetical protein
MISVFPMSQNTNTEPTAESWLEIVRQRVEAMRFGSVQIVVHEGRVTQVESTEKTRLPSEATIPSTKK